MYELVEAGCPEEFIKHFRKVHHMYISAADMLVEARKWPGGKEHFMANEAFEELEQATHQLCKVAQAIADDIPTPRKNS